MIRALGTATAMSDYDRRGGPPQDEPLAFDRREAPAPRGPAPLTLILSILLLMALAAAIFAFYRGGLSQGTRAPKTIGTPVGDLRAAPPAGGTTAVDPAAGLKIYQQADGEPSPSQPNFTPPPEQPLPRPLAPPVQATVQPPATVTPVAPPTATASPPPAAVTVLPKPAPPPVKPVVKPAEKPAEKLPTKPAPAPAAPGGGAGVQIGAFSSEAIASQEWSAAVSRAGGEGRGKRVEKIEREGSTLYRTTVTGFPDRASATAFCERLKAAGKSCFVR
jgi:SPOR domain